MIPSPVALSSVMAETLQWLKQEHGYAKNTLPRATGRINVLNHPIALALNVARPELGFCYLYPAGYCFDKARQSRDWKLLPKSVEVCAEWIAQGYYPELLAPNGLLITTGTWKLEHYRNFQTEPLPASIRSCGRAASEL